MDKTRTGFAGLGRLGTPIAMNLIERGYPLRVYNRTREKIIPLAERGAVAIDTVKELAGSCDVVFTMVSDDQALRDITEGKDGLVANMLPGSIHISMSTVSPGLAGILTRMHKDAGHIYLAAPVLGRPETARARHLTILVAGEGDAVRRVEPVWKDLGAAAVHMFGEDPAAANTVKLCMNFLIASSIEALSEAYALAERSGVDPGGLYELLAGNLFNCPIFSNYGKLILDPELHEPSFTLKLGLKDINLVLEAAAGHSVSMEQARILKERLKESIELDRGGWDWTALSRIAREKHQKAG